MYHNPKDQQSFFSSGSESDDIYFSPEEIELLRELAHRRVKFMEQADTDDSDSTDTL